MGPSLTSWSYFLLRHNVCTGAEFVSHGATGKGNDQVRFELTFYALAPSIKVIAPWRDDVFLEKFKGRTDLLNYARAKGIEMPSGDKPPYSMDENLMHISYESGDLEDPKSHPKEEMYSKTETYKKWPDTPEIIRVEFSDGKPTKVTSMETEESQSKPLELYLFLNRIAKKHGIGRIDIVENRFVGIKSRGVYETPGMTILRCAHVDIEGIEQTRNNVLSLRHHFCSSPPILSPFRMIDAKRSYMGFRCC